MAGQWIGSLVHSPQVTYSGNGSLWSYDLRSGKAVVLIRGLEQLPVTWAWSPDGSLLAYVLLDSQGSYHLNVWSPRTRRSHPVARDLPVGSPPQWSPEGDMIAVVDANQDICLYPSAAGVRRCLNVQPASQPVWSPDGQSIAFLPRLHLNGLSRVDLASGLVTPIFTGGQSLNHPRWSPDGTQIAFSHVPEADGIRHIFVVPAAGGEAVPITGGRSAQDQPVWSPDGRWIAYVDDPAKGGVQADVAVVNLDTGETTPVTAHPMNDSDPRWSPNGEWLAFVSDRFNGQPRLQLVPADRLSRAEPLDGQGIGMVLYAFAWRP
jgi:Tol biopolymer transport system component